VDVFLAVVCLLVGRQLDVFLAVVYLLVGRQLDVFLAVVYLLVGRQLSLYGFYTETGGCGCSSKVLLMMGKMLPETC
jgi:hypothetical protein